MTSATIRPVGSTGGRHADARGYGLILFASILLLVVGFFNMIYGIAAIANPEPGRPPRYRKTPVRQGPPSAS